MSESIYDLFTKVREHPDFLFGTIFTPDDFDNPKTIAKIKERANRAEEALAAAGFEFAEYVDV